MFKFMNDHDNAPSFNTASFEFDKDVDYSKETGLSTHINLCLTQDNIPVVLLNSFGLSYKYGKSFSISIVEGELSKHLTKQIEPDGQSNYLFLDSPNGKIKITDGFKVCYITWTISNDQVQITTSEDDSVIIDFNKGVIDPNIYKFIDNLLGLLETMPEPLKPGMWKKISKLRDTFGLVQQ